MQPCLPHTPSVPYPHHQPASSTQIALAKAQEEAAQAIASADEARARADSATAALSIERAHGEQRRRSRSAILKGEGVPEDLSGDEEAQALARRVASQQADIQALQGQLAETNGKRAEAAKVGMGAKRRAAACVSEWWQ